MGNIVDLFSKLKTSIATNASAISANANTISTNSNNITNLNTGYRAAVNEVDSKVTVLNNSLLSRVPVGTLIQFAGDVAPAAWLMCNGAAVSRTDYADLFSVIGTTYGAGDGSTTFNLPDARDRFLEGAGTNSVYGGSSTVQPSSLNLNILIKY